MKDLFQIGMYVDQLWNYDIAHFEEHEVKSWNSQNPLLTEARSCARMEAYVKLMELII